MVRRTMMAMDWSERSWHVKHKQENIISKDVMVEINERVVGVKRTILISRRVLLRKEFHEKNRLKVIR